MPILFEVVIPNLVCGFLWDVGVGVTLILTLTSDLISGFFVSGAYTSLLQIPFLICVLICYINSFVGIHHITVTFLVQTVRILMTWCIMQHFIYAYTD